MIGTLLRNRYRIDAKLGEGGMGTVYKAHDTLLDRAVAIKTLSPHLLGEEGLRRLLREAQAAAKLTHPNIVAVYDVLEADEQRLIVMEYVEGQTLRALIPLPWQRAVAVAADVCRALASAHERGIIHRDIKPENIIVAADGTAKVMDFGLARSEGRSRLTQAGMIVGTVAYMAPEQVLRGEADARSDLYALGCVLYEVLTGKPPFASDDPLALISQHLATPPVAPRWANPQIPPTLDAIVLKLMAKVPADRYPSAAPVGEALVEVKAASDGARAAPSFTTLDVLRRSRFVGRDREVEEMRDAVDRMLGGEGGAVFVVGEPGIGKTRLCQEVTIYARLRGCPVWWGQNYERETALPYGPWVEVFKTAKSEVSDQDWQEVAARAPRLAALLPDLAGPIPDMVGLPPEQEKARLFEQVAQLIAGWSRHFPIAVLLDDLHWADAATLDLLHYLSRAVRRERVLLIATYRDVEVDVQHPFAKVLGDMNRERLYRRVLLRRLDEGAVAAMIAAAFDEAASLSLRAAVYRETEGNPFFVEEVLRDLIETGAVYRADGGWGYRPQAALRVPESIREAVGRRLARLSDPCRQALTVASVIGREFAFDTLRVAAGLDEDGLLAQMDEALNAHLLSEVRGRVGEDRYAFQHALIRETLYEGLNPRRRARLHRQVGEAYEQLFSSRPDAIVDDLAYHFGHAEQSQAEKGIRYNVQAAERAAAVFAHEGAEARLKVALELAEGLGDDALIVEMHERLGDLFLRVQEGQNAVAQFEQALRAAERAGDPADDQRARLQLKIIEACARWAARHPDAERLAEAVIASPLAARDPRVRAQALIYLSGLYRRAGDERALATAQQALSLSESLGDPKILSAACDQIFYVYWQLGDWDKGYPMALRRLELLSQIDDIVELWDVHSTMASASMISGKYREAQHHADREVELARKMQSPTALGLSLYDVAWVYHGVGSWREAVQYGKECLALAERVYIGTGNVLYLHMWVGSSAAYIGDMGTARHHAAAAGELTPSWAHGQRNFVQARILLTLDDLDGAARHVTAMPEEWPPCAQCQDLYRLVYAEFYARTGEPERAEAAAREVLREGGRGRLWFEGEAFYNLGLAALARNDPGAAIDVLTRARDLLTEVGHISTLAQTWKELGRAYALRRGEGDAARARDALTQARQLFVGHGATDQAPPLDALLSTL